MSGLLRAKAIHIDSTILFAPFKRQDEKIRQALAVLSEYEIKTASSFSRLEFKRSWLQDMNYMHSLLIKGHDPAGLLNAAKNALVQRPRRVSRILEIFNRAWDEVAQSTPKSHIASRLRDRLRIGILTNWKKFAGNVDTIFNGTACLRATEPPKLNNETGAIDCSVPSCRRKKIRCKVHEFHSANAGHFGRIRDITNADETASAELRESSRTSSNAAVDPETLCDDRTCKKMGDAIIAVDGASLPVFAANNDKEWSLIAKALGKDLVNPIAIAKHGNVAASIE